MRTAFEDVESRIPELLKNVQSGPADAKPSAVPLKKSAPPLLYKVLEVTLGIPDGKIIPALAVTVPVALIENTLVPRLF